MIEFPLLTSEDIEVKPKQVTKNGALLLLYKTSRTDARILDETLGPMNWTNSYEEVKGNLYCKVGIRESEDQEFVYKMDCGIESDQKDDERKKAEASDAFKRCCSKLGIGRELYSSPIIWADVATKQNTQGAWVLEDPYAKYIITKISYNEKTRIITELVISNSKSGKAVYSWKMPESAAMMAKMVKTLAPVRDTEDIDPAPVTPAPVKAVKEPVSDTKVIEVRNSPSTEKTPLKTLVKKIGDTVRKIMETNGNIDAYNSIVSEVTGGATFKCNTATEEQYDLVNNIYTKLVEKGYAQ